MTYRLVTTKNKNIGWVKNGVYRKVVSKKRHLMKKHNAWGIDEQIINDPEIKEVRIKDTDTDTIYSASTRAIRYHALAENYEGLQFFYPVDKWFKEKVKKS